MNDMIKRAVSEACGGFDIFEEAFAKTAAKHRFSGSHRRRMKMILNNAENPGKIRAKTKRRHTAGRRIAAIAAGVIVLGSLGIVLYGEKLMYVFSDIVAPQNKRFDYLLSDGNYYLNGDRSSGIYFKIKDGTVTLSGDRQKLIDFYLREGEQKGGDLRSAKEQGERTVDFYLAGTKYAIVKTGDVGIYDEEKDEILPTDLFEFAFVERVDQITEPWYLYIFIFDYYSLTFDGYRTLRLHPIGDFILG